MKKKAIVGAIASGVILLGVTSNINKPKPTITTSNNTSTTKKSPAPKPTVPTCDGTSTTSGCDLDGVKYKTYIYHAAVAEKSHTEQVTTYEKKVSGYCTLCSDGTYSPSCATGRGACSYHGGVAQWNAPRYTNEPIYTSKTVVDAPAQDAYYEKVTN